MVRPFQLETVNAVLRTLRHGKAVLVSRRDGEELGQFRINGPAVELCTSVNGEGPRWVKIASQPVYPAPWDYTVGRQVAPIATAKIEGILKDLASGEWPAGFDFQSV